MTTKSSVSRRSQSILAGDTQLRPFSPEIMEAASEAYAETSAENPRFKRTYDSIVAFRGDSYLWWQVAEMSLDSFQLRMRART